MMTENSQHDKDKAFLEGAVDHLSQKLGTPHGIAIEFTANARQHIAEELLDNGLTTKEQIRAYLDGRVEGVIEEASVNQSHITIDHSPNEGLTL